MTIKEAIAIAQTAIDPAITGPMSTDEVRAIQMLIDLAKNVENR